MTGSLGLLRMVSAVSHSIKLFMFTRDRYSAALSGVVIMCLLQSAVVESQHRLHSLSSSFQSSLLIALLSLFLSTFPFSLPTLLLPLRFRLRSSNLLTPVAPFAPAAAPSVRRRTPRAAAPSSYLRSLPPIPPLLPHPMAQRSAEARPREVKVVLLGDTGVGKSSLVLRFVTNNFKPYSESTIGSAAKHFVGFVLAALRESD